MAIKENINPFHPELTTTTNFTQSARAPLWGSYSKWLTVWLVVNSVGMVWQSAVEELSV